LEDGQRKAGNAVYALLDGADAWTELDQLTETIAGAAAANASDSMICVGGLVDGQASSKVVKYSLADGKLASESLPDPPMPLAAPAAAVTTNHLYVGSSLCCWRHRR
jgi:N-acetylneuraminic acid mutarotase